jgi:hypothetical protein
MPATYVGENLASLINSSGDVQKSIQDGSKTFCKPQNFQTTTGKYR